eukprot:g4690.t1
MFVANYVELKDICVKFLSSYSVSGRLKYVRALRSIRRRRSTVLSIEISDLLNSPDIDEDFVIALCRNTRRYREIFCQAVDEMNRIAEVEIGTEDSEEDSEEDDSTHFEEDVFDVLRRHRLDQAAIITPEDAADEESNNPRPQFPPGLNRRYEVHFVPPGGKLLSSSRSNGSTNWPNMGTPLSLREVRASDVGRLKVVKAICTRVSQVKPIVSIATYTCDQCGYEIYQEVKSKTFMPLRECASELCKKNDSKGKLHLQARGSKFVKYQEIKVQELPNQVPYGRIPCSMTVIANGELTRRAKAGDLLTIAGIFLPTPFTGLSAIKAGLIADTYLEATYIEKQKKSYSDVEMTEEMGDAVDEAAEDPELYSKMARSLAPEIFSHEDVKKALLLMLVGGVTRKMKDGMKIRGDINICLMGDPGVAKSQLLKHIATVSPRSVYTTGKGSSGVGLTAAVLRDSTTGEMALEGGALVLADMGICCIDEFDKMEDADRTAIHEVMEQQTVSIAKAGITTTLNARTAILAAANPLYGRYNKRKSPAENINLPAALLSRFDLLFLILDKADMDMDTALARHITHVHMHNKPPALSFEPMTTEFIRAYISQARRLDPHIPPELSGYIVQAYVDMRQRDAESAKDAGAQSVMTARQLLSILRLSQALARLRFSTTVSNDDVEEAIRLVHMCKASLLEDDDFTGEDVMTRVYSLIRDFATSRGDTTINFAAIERLLLTKGFTEQQINDCIDEYESINVWKVNASRTQIVFVN